MSSDEFVLALARCLPLNQPASQFFTPDVLHSAPAIEPEADATGGPEPQQQPPQPQPELPPPRMPQCFLCFQEANGGSLVLHWTRERHVDGALAAFMPLPGTVPEFKLSRNAGRSELCRGVGGPNAKPYYNGWVSFIKQAKAHPGCTFLHLADVANPARHIAIYAYNKASTVRRLALCIPLLTDELVAVAVVHTAATAYVEGCTMARRMVRDPTSARRRASVPELMPRSAGGPPSRPPLASPPPLREL